jgi:cytidylate kinase
MARAKSTREERTYDAIVVGGGHNGLTNAAYLAKGGMRVLVLERRPIVGGAAITEELRPGFWFTTFSYALSLLRPDIIHDLDLVKHGFMPILMPTTFCPKEDGDYLLLGQDHDENHKEIERHSKHDADAYDAFNRDVNKVLQAIKPLLDEVPPDIFSDDPEELIRLAALGSRFRRLDRKVLHDAVRLLTGSAADFLDDYFKSDILKGYLASTSIIGTKVGPYSQGSGLVLLYHLLGEHDGEFGAWAFHKQGNGGFTKVLARAAAAFGAEIKLESPVDHVVTEGGRATGVVLGDGSEYHASVVVSALDPRRTFTELVDPRELPTDLVDAIRRFRFQGTSAKVNFALDGVPRYPALGDRTDQYRGFTNIGPSMEYLERAFDDAKYGWYSKRPYLDCAIQSTVDPDMAPPGKAVMSCFVQCAVQAPRERLGHGEGGARRHRAGDARVVLPGLRQARPPARGAHAARHRANRRAVGGQHLCRRVPRAADVLLPAGARLVAVPDTDRGVLPVRLGHASGRLRDGRAGQARGGPGAEGSRAGQAARGQGRRRRRLRHTRRERDGTNGRACGHPQLRRATAIGKRARDAVGPAAILPAMVEGVSPALGHEERGLVVALDGPASSGKSSVGAAAAARLGYRFCDTGLLYRAVTWLALHRVVSAGDPEGLVRLVGEIELLDDGAGRLSRVAVGGVDRTVDVRQPDVDLAVSAISGVVELRRALLDRQRALVDGGRIVMAGRDIGTVVLPDADLKLFLDASVEERASRRALERDVDPDSAQGLEILDELRRRDQLDSSRPVAPLRAADDAVVIRTDGNELETTVELVVQAIQRAEADRSKTVRSSAPRAERPTSDRRAHSRRPPVEPTPIATRLGILIRLGSAVLRWIARSIVRLRIEGDLASVPRTGPLIVAANHASSADPVLIGPFLNGILGRPLNWLGKRELVEYPLTGWAFRKAGIHPVDRDAADLEAFRTAMRILDAGNVLAVFPEGTRSRDGSLQAVREGVGMLALRSGAPVLPVAVIDSDLTWPRGHLLPRFGRHVTVRYGAPFNVADELARATKPGEKRDRRAATEAATRLIMTRIAALLPPRQRGVYAANVGAASAGEP